MCYSTLYLVQLQVNKTKNKGLGGKEYGQKTD